MASPDPRSNLAHARQSLGAESAKVMHLHMLERVLLAVVLTKLVFLPWAVGGMYFWTQIVAGALALGAFVTALIPREYSELHHGGGNLRLIMWPRLLRFPFFWLGLIYFGFVVTQIFNPAWRYVSSDQGWWLEAVDYIKWLPHGIADTPVLMMNGWRTLLIQGTAWMLVCALWVGITRRKTVRVLVTVLAVNGVTQALVVLAERLTHSPKFLWLWDNVDATGAGSFIYKNHAGEYFLLIIASCLGLAWWHTTHAENRLQKSNPGAFFVFLGGLTSLALIFSYARAASALGVSMLVIVSVAYCIRLLYRHSGGPPRIVSAMTLLLGIGFMALCLSSFNTELVWSRFGRLFKEDRLASVTTRELAAHATLDMARDSLIVGHGAGDFRFLFPLYQSNYPEIWREQVWNGKTWAPGNRLYWEHAHNDYAEFLAEVGLVGTAFAAVTLILIIAAMRRETMVRQPALLVLLLGPAFVALSALVDFPAQNPAVLVTSCALVALPLRWAQLERP